MCRFVAYMGHNMLMDEILLKPYNSIILQSLEARETTVPTNGDGFGLGWYVPEISTEPALFTSVFPAWSDQNLRNLTAKIKSGCFFAHVRAAGVGSVNTNNCHPFIFKNCMLMHNGDLFNFLKIKRHLRHLLDDDIYNWIQGETDSEHFFALFLQNAKGKVIDSLQVMADIFRATLDQIMELETRYGENGPSFYNICITDGKRMVASRYSTRSDEYLSLHYSQGSHFAEQNGQYRMEKNSKNYRCSLISSEQLTDVCEDWETVPPNHVLLIDGTKEALLLPV